MILLINLYLKKKENKQTNAKSRKYSKKFKLLISARIIVSKFKSFQII